MYLQISFNNKSTRYHQIRHSSTVNDRQLPDVHQRRSISNNMASDKAIVHPRWPLSNNIKHDFDSHDVFDYMTSYTSNSLS